MAATRGCIASLSRFLESGGRVSLPGFSYAHSVNEKLIANRQDPVNHFLS